MFLGKELGLSLEQVFELSLLELRLWGAYYSLEHKDKERSMKDGKRRHNR
jgi:hypothetical protein